MQPETSRMTNQEYVESINLIGRIWELEIEIIRKYQELIDIKMRQNSGRRSLTKEDYKTLLDFLRYEKKANLLLKIYLSLVPEDEYMKKWLEESNRHMETYSKTLGGLVR